MNRKDFIRLTLGTAVAGPALSSCSPKKKIKGSIIGASSSVGHLLRDGKFYTPAEAEKTKVVIVGAGISGLSCGRQLYNKGIKDFILLDLEKEPGGNAAYGKNSVSAYPWGAHYIPIPNNDLPEYHSFLQECGVITGYDQQQVPVYNDLYLCFDPQERLYINGRWQDGLVPDFGVPDEEKKQVSQFLQLMNEYREVKGSDNKYVFAIPVDRSSRDPKWLTLDSITMQQWLQQNGFTGKYLNHYINYCCRDDFGTTVALISAWTGLHYFASRKGNGVNADHSDVLTWPEGNGFLVNQLRKNINSHIRTNSLAVKVRRLPEGVRVEYLDALTKEVKAIEADQCVLCVPQFVAGRLLSDNDRLKKATAHLHYTPWMVANLTVGPLEERSGAPASWDNVIFESKSLGYVEATHESLQQDSHVKNITYYLPLTGKSPSEERKLAQSKTHEEWVSLIINDLKVVHPNIEEATQEVNVMVWGHAMAQPLPGLFSGNVRKELSASVGDKIHFAHTDLAGISIFEEGFYQGLGVAEKIVSLINKNTG